MKFKWVSSPQDVVRPVPEPFATAPTPSTAPNLVKVPIKIGPVPVVPGPRIPPVTQGPAATTADIPTLEGDAAKAVTHRGSHIRIIAAAG